MTLTIDERAIGGTAPPRLGMPSGMMSANYSFTVVAGSGGTKIQLVGYQQADMMRAEFNTLADQWHAETGLLSSPVQIAMHPAYQRIIGHGARMIPFILADLKSRGGQWYWALRALTGESPVPTSAAGNIRIAKAAWLAWGVAHGYAS